MEFTYSGQCSDRDDLGRLNRCNLHVYRRHAAVGVIAGKRADNPGSSITNSYENFTTGLWQNMNFFIDQVTWIEHYDNGSFGRRIDEICDSVTLRQEGDRLVSPA